MEFLLKKKVTETRISCSQWHFRGLHCRNLSKLWKLNQLIVTAKKFSVWVTFYSRNKKPQMIVWSLVSKSFYNNWYIEHYSTPENGKHIQIKLVNNRVISKVKLLNRYKVLLIYWSDWFDVKNLLITHFVDHRNYRSLLSDFDHCNFMVGLCIYFNCVFM